MTGENNSHKNKNSSKATEIASIPDNAQASAPPKRTLSKSKSNSQKIYELTSKATSCVSHQTTGRDSSDSYAAAYSNTSTATNKTNNIINTGFNSLRRMLKISTVSDPNKASLISKKSRNKCLSASATPLPSCLAPNQFGNSYTDSQTSAYLPAKVKSKGKRRSSPSVSRALSKLSLNRHQSVASLSSTKSSKQSFNPSNFTKSIINQTNSSFSTASLSSNNCTPIQQAVKHQQIEAASQKQSYHSLNNCKFFKKSQ